MGLCRVLCGVDEATGSLAGVRGLRAAGYEPWLALSHEHTYVALTRDAAGSVRLPDPKAEPERYAVQLAAEAKRLDAALVLPFTEGVLQALSGHEARFDPVVVGACSPEVLERATDKGLLPELCRQAGLDVPPTFEVRSETLDEVELEFPAVVKPRSSVTSAGSSLRRNHVVLVDGRDELERHVRRSPEDVFFVQAQVEGTLAAICGVAWQGRLVCASHQVSPRIWPPHNGISAFARTVPPDEALEAAVARLLDLIGWSGIFGLQFIRNGTTAYAIDLNPRIYGSAALAIAAGHNLPAIWADLLLGREPAIPPYRVGVCYRAETNDLRALAAQFRNGNRQAAIRGLVPRRDTVHAVVSLRDPLPGLEILRNSFSSLIGRDRRGGREQTVKGNALVG